MTDTRSEVRMLCADMVDVRWRNPAGKMRHEHALLEDIARSGACLQFEMPVPLGVELHVKCKRREYSGIVRYCVYREIGYFVGVEFEPDSQWSPMAFRPQHLLDLRKLADGRKQ